ncbi:hypothetical protein F66182_9719 [Fusarium sp. NRRL 66182]|nr:hypothetical protein F66182_9719 [Fusarium sp. NRRL 66182]
MQLTLNSIVLSHVLTHVLAAEQKAIGSSCDEFWGVIGCTRTLTFPSYPSPVYDSSGVQTGVQIVTENVNICDAITTALGDSSFVSNSKTNCDCLSSAVYYSSNSFFKAMYDGKIPDASSSGWLDIFYNNERCLLDADYTMSTDRSSVVKNQLSATNGWTIVRAPEIDLSVYRKLVKALATCQSGTCDGPKIRAFFSSYIDNAESIIDSEFVRMLNNWIKLFESLRKKAADVNTYSKQVQTRLKTVSSKVNSVKASVCKNNACKGSTATNAFKKCKYNNINSSSLSGVPGAAARSVANVPKMTQIVRNALQYTTRAADETYYVGLINDYEINSLRDFIKAFKITQYFPQAADDLKRCGNEFNLITNHAGSAANGAASINSILAVNWSKNTELSKTAASRKVRDGLINIQKSFKNELKGPLDNLVKANKALEDLLKQFQLRRKRLEFVSGGAPYNRWTDVDMEVPCGTETTKTYNVNGFTQDYTWKQVNACQFGPTKVPFVKQFIPFIKYRFV